MNGYSAIAAAVNDLAKGIDDALAGGEPPKWVAQRAVKRAREVAWAATMAGNGKLAPAALDVILRAGAGDGDTVTLRCRQPEPQPSGPRRGRLAGYVRRQVARMRPGAGTDT